ncbi:hypothetical protein [Chitinimonas sp.]|uniref:hypothetical protein n=1 Tax=Chitinimonas sp. TaxID=1934313 RepID=UPI0035B2187B
MAAKNKPHADSPTENTPAATAPPIAQAGGSYVADPVSGELTRAADTEDDATPGAPSTAE